MAKKFIIHYENYDIEMLKYAFMALKEIGFDLYKKDCQHSINTLNLWEAILFDGKMISLAGRYYSSADIVFTFEDIFNGNIRRFYEESFVDTTITLANGKKIELSIEDYKKLVETAKED